MSRHAAVALLASTLVAASAGAQHAIDPEAWIEMRRMMRAEGPAPPIEQDVAALAGPEARRAGPRLIDRGPEVLPAVHAALLDPALEPRHGFALLQVVQPLADPSSVPVVLELAAREPPSPLRRDALRVLAFLPPSDAAEAHVRALAASAEPWRMRRMAFTWYALQQDPRGRPLAEALRGDPDPERRAAALWVLARLGDASALEPVSALLAEGAPSELRDVLLGSLAELVGPDEFERRAPESLAWSSGYQDALRYARYRTAPAAERPAVCREMLRAEMPGHRELAVRCLLETGHADDLRPAAALDMEVPGRDALIRNDIRKAGWRVIDTESEFRIVPGGAAAPAPPEPGTR